MKEYFKIGEISKLYHIGVDSLRYYEEIGLITPQRSKSGYRLYSVSDIWRLNVIRDLRELGFHMDQIRAYFTGHSVNSTLSLLNQEKEAIDRKLKALAQLRQEVTCRENTLQEAQNMPLNQIWRQHYPLRHCLTIPEGYAEDHEMDVLIKRLVNLDQDHLYVIGSNQIGTVLSLEKGILKSRAVFVIDEHGNQSLPAGEYLSVCYQGNYQQSLPWTKALYRYAESHDLTIAGDVLEILWIDIHTTALEEEYLTELQVRVTSNHSIDTSHG